MPLYGSRMAADGLLPPPRYQGLGEQSQSFYGALRAVQGYFPRGGHMAITAILEHYGADVTYVHGKGWQPLRCPFHDDRHASASVSLARDAFRCHGCGARGNAVTLLMRQEGIDFEAAHELAASISGEGLPGIRRADAHDRPRRKSRWRDQLFEGSCDDG